MRVRRAMLGSGPPRVAYAVGRAAGNAVARNRLRRRLRAAVREHADLLEPGVAYLVGAGREALGVSYETLSAAVARALEAGDRPR